ncbi:hypothetical protein ACFV2D_34505 [Streptomyces capillispiralis]|uniref:hypothetical protein n=1 Tax=Streptomyces capillispiralis TaxID=68182 RepID=UPI00368AB96F
MTTPPPFPAPPRTEPSPPAAGNTDIEKQIGTLAAQIAQNARQGKASDSQYQQLTEALRLGRSGGDGVQEAQLIGTTLQAHLQAYRDLKKENSLPQRVRRAPGVLRRGAGKVLTSVEGALSRLADKAGTWHPMAKVFDALGRTLNAAGDRLVSASRREPGSLNAFGRLVQAVGRFIQRVGRPRSLRPRIANALRGGIAASLTAASQSLGRAAERVAPAPAHAATAVAPAPAHAATAAAPNTPQAVRPPSRPLPPLPTSVQPSTQQLGTRTASAGASPYTPPSPSALAGVAGLNAADRTPATQRAAGAAQAAPAAMAQTSAHGMK